MIDLTATMFYKTKFSITAVDGTKDLLWETILHIKRWLMPKAKRWEITLPTKNPDWTILKYGGRISSDGEDTSIFIESEAFRPLPTQEEQYWACRIVERGVTQSGVCQRQWITEIGFEQTEKATAVFSCVISYSDNPGFIGPCEEDPSPTLPGLIRAMLTDPNLKCTSGSDKVELLPQRLVVGDWPSFWERLKDKSRELPYVYISSKRECDSKEVTMTLNPADLATILCGNAIVFYPDSHDFQSEMSYMSLPDYTCYSGMVRIYFPKLDPSLSTDSYRHRYLSASYVQELGEKHVLRILRRAFAQNVKFYESFFRVDECRKKKDEFNRRKRLKEIQEQYKEQLSKVQDGKLDEAIEEEQKRLEAEELVSELQLKNKQLEQEIYNLSAQLSELHIVASRRLVLEAASQNRFTVAHLPNSPQTVINYFANTFADKIAFTDDALKSAKYCTIPNSELWDFFFNLVTKMHELHVNGCSDVFARFRVETGYDCARGASMMTRKNKELMRQFVTSYKDKDVNIEPHYTYPKLGQSIHFNFLREEQKIIVGHCGEHCEIYSSQKVK
jgi:hypothetical protein